MAKNVDIIEGKGVIYKFTISTVAGNYVLKDNANKEEFIELLLEYENQNVCLLGYCLLDSKICIIAKGATKKSLINYVATVSKAFYIKAQSKGFPFRPTVDVQKVNDKNLTTEINAIHHLAPIEIENYPYCSLEYLKSGLTDAVSIIKNSSDDIATKEDFENKMNASIKIKQRAIADKEDFSIVMEQAKSRYISANKATSETNIVFVIAEVCDRTKLSYKKTVSKMGINKNRRDLMIGVICDMIIRRKYTLDTVIVKLGLLKESKMGIALETIAELNRVYNYSYDYCISLLGISDKEYSLLAVLVRGINKQFGYEYETICKQFHLVNDLIPLRQKCGL
jgi:hypothetical protein